MKHLLVEYLPRVYRFALRLARDSEEAEEVVQETYLRAWRNQEGLRDPSAMRTWLFRIAANVWRDRVRASARSRTETLPDDVADPVDSPPHASAEHEDQVQRVERLMRQLPDRQRQVLYLSAFEGMEHAEIGRVLDISRESVKANLSLARRAMRDRLAQADREG